MKARIKNEARFSVGKPMSLDSMCNYLKNAIGLSREEAEEHINILCNEGLCVHDDEGYRILATMPVISSMA